MEEVWKDIKGYENLYQVSNLGRVRKIKCKLLASNTLEKGYKRVHLFNNEKLLVHRLVAQAFIPNPNNYPIVNHKDENPSNNCVDNLEWCTYSYNISYGKQGERRGRWNKIPIYQYSKDGVLIRLWDSAADAQRELSIWSTSIIACCKGKHNSAGGYIWKYAI